MRLNCRIILSVLISFAILIAGFCIVTYSRGHKNQFYCNYGYLMFDDSRNVKHSFAYFNDGAKPIVVKRLVKSCTCTTATIDKHVIQPGETAKIQLLVNVPNAFRENQISCYMETDSLEYRKIHYQLDFVSLPRILVEPPLLSIGTPRVDGPGNSDAAAGESAEALVTLFYNPKILSPRSLRVAPPPFLVLDRVDRLKTIRLSQDIYKSQYRIKLSFKKNLAKIQSSLCYISLDGGQGFATTVPINVKGDTKNIAVFPDRINFGVVDLQAGLSHRDFLVKSNGKSVSVSSDSPYVTVDELERKSAYVKFRVSLRGSASAVAEQRQAQTLLQGGIEIRLQDAEPQQIQWMALSR